MYLTNQIHLHIQELKALTSGKKDPAVRVHFTTIMETKSGERIEHTFGDESLVIKRKAVRSKKKDESGDEE